MDAFHMGEVFWVLVLTVPVLVVLLALCIDCQDPELDTPHIGDYEEKPPTTFHPQTFRRLRRPPCDYAPPFSANFLSDAKSLTSQSPSFIGDEGNYDESISSFENEVIPFIPDDEENYYPGYIVVLPDVPIVNQKNEDHTSTDSIVGQYENMPESQQQSPGDYVNVLEPEATILDPCIGAFHLPAVDTSHCTSDQESEDDAPDYENV